MNRHLEKVDVFFLSTQFKWAYPYFLFQCLIIQTLQEVNMSPSCSCGDKMPTKTSIHLWESVQVPLRFLFISGRPNRGTCLTFSLCLYSVCVYISVSILNSYSWIWSMQHPTGYYLIITIVNTLDLNMYYSPLSSSSSLLTVTYPQHRPHFYQRFHCLWKKLLPRYLYLYSPVVSDHPYICL